MTGRILPPGTYGFDDVALSDRIETAALTVTPAMIDAFCDLTGDRFEIHLSDAAAQRHGFAARVAHGLLVLSLLDGLKNQCPAQFRAIASLGWEWSFRAPVLANDTLSASFTVNEKRPTSRPDRGILRLEVVSMNQRGAVVQRGHNLLMVYR
ncbi:MAG: MaoC family dehydratase [Cypionkella sp.]